MHESVRLVQQIAKLQSGLPVEGHLAAEGPGVSVWPVNEIVLQSLIMSGNDDDDIATRYGAELESVYELRKRYRL